MVTYLLENGKIETTVTRAKEVRSMTEKMITLAKENNLHNYRQAMAYVTKEDVVKKLFDEAYRAETKNTADGNVKYSLENAGEQSSTTDSDSEVRFSLSESVEQTKDLVALHNLTADKLTKSLELGGLPMPSLAITKADIPHSKFGDITLVFGKETIDPKANKKNKVYSADAWTPVFPRTEYEANSEVEKRISQKVRDLSGKVDDYFQRDLNRVSYDFEDYLNRYDGEEGLIQNVMDNYGLKAAYLEEQGCCTYL
jgi:antitoxin component HigA of HigAB toxin-antitoxin module